MITLLNKFDDGYVMNKEDIKKVFLEKIREYNLEDYYKDIKFEMISDYMAYYSTGDGLIHFDDKKVNRVAYDYCDNLISWYNADEDYYTYYLNFYFLYFIYHEIRHLLQLKMRKNDSFASNNYLYDVCHDLRKNKNFYKENHNSFPMEIDAANFGLLKAFEILSHTKMIPRERRILQAEYLSSLHYRYALTDEGTVKSPVEMLALKSDLVDLGMINNISSHNHLSKMDRVNLGLPITVSEYNELKNKEEKVLSLIKKQ